MTHNVPTHTLPTYTLPTHKVLGYEVAACRLEQAVTWCVHAAHQPTAREPAAKLVVTLNPEIVVRARDDDALAQAIHQAELITADGVGILWAAKQAGAPLPERVSGVDLMFSLLAADAPLKVFLLGSQPGVAARAAEVAKARYNAEIVGVQHGYFDKDNPVEVLEHIASSGANILFAGLGEGQEVFLHQHREQLAVPVMMGVGGALDVLAGEVYRAPQWTRQLGVEWAWRVGGDPKRWHRIPRLWSFVQLVRRQAGE
jgi:N-acetylglucosaminyldiphosphoundecaprenol N-acetyl-beta-D-mannosaminyltransferase